MRVLVLVGLAMAPLAAAQTPPLPSLSSSSLTLTGAVTEAFAVNPELVALRREYEVARAAPAQERALMPPMFEAQIWGWPVTTLNPARTDMYMFMGEQDIPGRGKRASRVAVAERDADVVSSRVLVRANEIVGEVRQAYLDLALARDTLAVYDRQTPILHDMADAATLRYASGGARQQDTVRAIGEMARLSADRIAWSERAGLAAARLNALLGRRGGTPVILRTNEAATAPALADLERIAVDRHPAIAAASAEIAREEAELARLRGDRRPDFVVGGGYMLQPGGAGAWTAKAGLTWPNAPWSRDWLTASIDVQAKRVEAAKARRDAAAAGIRREVQEALVRLDAARQRVDLIQTTVLPHAEHEFGLARVSYAGERGSFAELLDSQRMLLSAEVNGAAATADVEKAIADLQRVTGELPEAQP